MLAPTPRQQEILALIRRFVAETGYPPTPTEIARTLGFHSTNAAKQHMRVLARKDAIEVRPGATPM